MSKPKQGWPQIKNLIKNYSNQELIDLIAQLHSLTQINKDFLASRFLQNNHVSTIERYKADITKHIAPKEPWKESQKINIKAAKVVLGQYQKIFKDQFGLIDLMLHYVECGSNFSVDFGVYESYHISLEATFSKALKLMKQCPNDDIKSFLSRTFSILEFTREKMWEGHYERMRKIFDELYGG